VEKGWIGLYDIAEEGVFRWISDMKLAYPSFWGSGQPDDNNIAEDCVELYAVNSNWNDQNCENNHVPFICEMQ
jgi:hypothetical protein